MGQEHSVRVSAHGEFGQLERGLKSLQKDLAGVLGAVDKGARQGGIFDDRQRRALDLYRERFKQTSDDITRELQRHTQIVEQLNRKMAQASEDERRRIREEINEREKKLNTLQRERDALNRLYDRRNQEANNYGNSGSSGGGLDSKALNEKADQSLLGKIGRRLLGGAKGALALAGIGGFGAILAQAYQEAYKREVNSLDLAQRIRGKTFSGSNTAIYDKVSATGRRDNMGYTQEESWQLQDVYSQTAGILPANQQYALQRFSRGYGLNASEVGATVAGIKSQGGMSSPKEFMNMVAGSVGISGMTPRVLEVMETSAGLLSAINTTLKDGSAKQILAYQTVLDKAGNEKGMSKLTGQQGANVIGGLAGVFSPQNEDWKWLGVKALQEYAPDKYGKMDLYGLERSFEDSLQNPDNLPALSKYFKQRAGGDTTTEKRFLQRWLQDGGYNATKTQVDDLYNATDGLTAFDKDKMASVVKSLEAGNSGAKYNERQGEGGQGILSTEAQYKKALEGIGSEFLGVITSLKSGVTRILTGIDEELDGIQLDDFTDAVDQATEALNKFIDSLPDPIKEKIRGAIDWGMDHPLTVMGGYMLGKPLVSNVLSRLKGFGRVPGAGAPAELLGEAPTGGSSGILSKLKGLGKKVALPLMIGAGLYNSSDRYDQYREAGAGRLEAGWKTLLDTLGAPRVDKDYQERLVARRDSIMEENGWDNNVWNRMKAMDQAEEEMKNELRGFSTEGKQHLSSLSGSGVNTLVQFAESGNLAIDGLTTKGTEELALLEKEGLLKIGSLDEKGRVQITDLSTKGAKKLAELEAQGKLHLEEMESHTKINMEEMREEHRGLKGFFTDLFQPLIDMLPDWVKKALGVDGDNSKTAGNVDANYNISQSSGVTSAQLNSKLKGKLSGQGETIINAGKMYGVDPAFLAGVMMHETGNGSTLSYNNPGGLMQAGGGLQRFNSLSEGIEATAKLMQYWYKHGRTTISQMGNTWAPIGAGNDPNGLNKNWVPGVINYMKQLGVGASDAPSSGSSFFTKNWEKGITSRFGDARSGGRKHEGLDLAGKQGQFLDALVDGQIVAIKMDDGSGLDADKRANTSLGGTEVSIKIPTTGEIYSYSHLSKINPDLLSRWFDKGERNIKVEQGDYIGNVGGQPGVPGSGSSTNGPHLHFTYNNPKGIKENPIQFIRDMVTGYGTSLSSGDSDTDFIKLMQEQASGAATQSTAPMQSSEVKHVYQHDLNINVTVSGGQNSSLSMLQLTALEQIVKQTVENVLKQPLVLNPTAPGW
jgi:hypothetical protein